MQPKNAPASYEFRMHFFVHPSDFGTRMHILVLIPKPATNPDLADILGDTDFDFENFHF